MTTVKLRGEKFVLRVPTNEDERHKLTWISQHYPVEDVRKEAAWLLTGPRCSAHPRGKVCEASAVRRCSICERAICKRHSVKLKHTLRDEVFAPARWNVFYVCLVCRWQSVPHLERA